MGQHDSDYKLLFSYPHLVECLIRGFVPGSWIERLDFSSLEPVREAHPRDEIDKLLARPEDAGLRRAFSLWLTTIFLPSRMSGVTVPTMEKLEEVKPMIAENAIDWSAQWRQEGETIGRRKGRREGEADLLLRQLSRLYGPLAPEVERRVRGAEADQLLVWAERVVTSGSLEEVFDHAGEGRG